MASYEVIREELPDYFKPVLEFVEIQKAQARGLDKLELAVSKLYDNSYISTCDEQTIAYYEQKLGIVYGLADTLELRRWRVLQKFNLTVPFSIGFLRNRLTELYGPDGFELTEDAKKLQLTIKITSDRYNAMDMLYDFLWTVIPAHIQISARQEVINDTESSLYTAGFMQSTFVQTIGGENDMDSSVYAAGLIQSTFVQTIGGKNGTL